MSSRYRFPEVSGLNPYFWCFAPEPIAAADLPLIVLSNTYGGLQVAEFPGSFTLPVPVGKFAGNLPACDGRECVSRSRSFTARPRTNSILSICVV